MRIPRAFCGHCLIEMVIDRTGMAIECIADWGSYYKIYSDVYVCPKDSSHVIFLPAERPVRENFEAGYEEWRTEKKVRFVS